MAVSGGTSLPRTRREVRNSLTWSHRNRATCVGPKTRGATIPFHQQDGVHGGEKTSNGCITAAQSFQCSGGNQSWIAVPPTDVSMRPIGTVPPSASYAFAAVR